MKLLKTLILMLGICIFASCEKDAEESSTNDSATSDQSGTGRYNYIDAYIDADSIHVTQYVHDKKQPVIWVFVEGMRYDSRGWSGETNYERIMGDLATYNKEKYAKLKEENRKVFDSIARQVGDTSFPRITGIPFEPCLVNDTIMGIDVVCNEDYDDTHKAGCSVADILDFYGSSPYEYIQNGYKDTKPDVRPQIVNEYGLGIIWQVTTCRIANIPDENLKFFQPSFFLVFDKLPAEGGAYTFDVTMKLSKKTLKNTVTMEF